MTPESILKQQVVETLVRLGYLVIRLNSGGSHNIPCLLWYTDEFKAKRAGVPDLLVFTFTGHVLPYFFVDTKATTKPTPEQLDFKAEIERRGGVCLFVKAVEDLMEQLDAVGML